MKYNLSICGKSNKHFMSINYDPTVVFFFFFDFYVFILAFLFFHKTKFTLKERQWCPRWCHRWRRVGSCLKRKKRPSNAALMPLISSKLKRWFNQTLFYRHSFQSACWHLAGRHRLKVRRKLFHHFDVTIILDRKYKSACRKLNFRYHNKDIQKVK